MTQPVQDLTGQQLSIAVLSPPVAGLLRTWTDDGPRLWRVDRPDELSALLGRGVVARTTIEDDRFREVGFVSPSGDLLVHGRMKQGQEQGPAQVFQLEPAQAEHVSDDTWAEFAQWLRQAVLAAARRGEFLVLERGGWEPAPTPFGLWGCFARDGVWSSVVEADPWPGELGPWAVASRSEGSATLAAPANREALSAAAMLAVMSVSDWAGSPWRLAVSFGSSPSGPLPEALLAPAALGPDLELVAALDGLGPVDAVRRLVLDLAAQRPVDPSSTGTYVSLRPADGGNVAIYAHRRRVSLALDPARASAAESALHGVKVEPRNDTTWYVVVPDDVISRAPANALAFAVEAVDRAVGH